MITDAEWQAILDRDTGDEETAMHSACGEYNCDCHYERDTLLTELRQLRADNNAYNELILLLAERIYGCSLLLTAAVNKVDWDSTEVNELMRQLRDTTRRDLHNAGIEDFGDAEDTTEHPARTS